MNAPSPQGPPQGSPPANRGKFSQWIVQYQEVFGIIAVALAFVATVVAVSVVLYKMGPSAWQTLSGGRAVLLLSLTFAFVTFGGALLITPFFAQADQLDDRFRRAREVFLLFSGMFSTVVGFYFASSGSPTEGSAILIAESLDLEKGALDVSVVGGAAPYMIEVEYGPAEAAKRKKVLPLEGPGTVNLQFDKKSDWPTPLVIRVEDSKKTEAERRVVTDRNSLLSAKYVEPKPTEPPQTPSEEGKAKEEVKVKEEGKAEQEAKVKEATKASPK